MPYSVAMDDLSDAEVFAYAITFSEFESGNQFDWQEGRFIER